MAGGSIKISKPERLPKEGVSETDLQAWWNELLNYLNQDEDFVLFKEGAAYAKWIAGEENPERIARTAGGDEADQLAKRRRQLNNYLTIIAGCISLDKPLA